ncbi:MAG TPA: TlpA disulfide reductase family protein, partial [Anseongella sp.]|nr:TlpA disulfide reductase family protein [Anseongella sp.]
SSFKGQPLLLDFWSHTCKACILSFPKLDRLQQRFDGRLKVVLVNRESSDSTERFFKRRPQIHRPGVTMLSGAEALISRFPLESYPYAVWVDADGVIRHLVSGNYLEKDLIERFIGGEELHLKNVTRPLVRGSMLNALDSSWSARIGYYSYLARCLDGVQVGQVSRRVTQDGRYVQMAFNCRSLKELYQIAYEEGGRYDLSLPGLIHLPKEDSLHSVRPREAQALEQWKGEHAFTYELQLPLERESERFGIMQEDLRRYFGYAPRVVPQAVKGWVLRKSAGFRHLTTKGGKSIDEILLFQKSGDSNRLLQFKNLPFEQFCQKLKLLIEAGLHLPFEDQTGLAGPADLTLRSGSVQSLSIGSLQEDLARLGLQLEFSSIVRPVLIVRPGTAPATF